jgi:hypothetical protein
MANKRDMRPLTTHHAVDTDHMETMTIYGHTGPCVRVTCPICKKDRWYAVRTIRHLMAKPAFTGACRPCWLAQPKGRRFRQKKRNPSGRRVGPNGYVYIGKNFVTDDELEWFDIMKRGSGHVLEHRWVMSLKLGRPLESNEFVDHMDGNKQNNDLSNLRIYIRGKNQQGSCPAHGTYYDEWQRERAEVKRLKALLRALGCGDRT